MDYLKFTPELAHDWKNAISATESEPYLLKRVTDSMNRSQLESKLWVVRELSELMLFPKSVVILGGWYANFMAPLLFQHGVSYITNFDLDPDVKRISYKFNKSHKDDETYKCYLTNVMFEPVFNIKYKSKPDMIINTSCEHMFPMTRFKKLNRGFSNDVIYVLQSTNEDKYEDHINCVNGPEELAEQAEFVDIMYSGTKKLDNGMDRFMVIGR
tara:strand:+ start:627 stop:1265 length:639 start_codon:yes stop_codon:yes gene_type:complete